MTKICFFVTFLLSMACTTIAQNSQNIPESANSQINTTQAEQDSSTIVSNTFFDIFNGNPGKAAFYGLIIPGGGQIYNKRWWKLPLVLGVEGGLIYLIITNTSAYKGYQDAYLRNLNGETFVYKGTSDVAILKRRRDSSRKAREYSWVYFIGGHLVILFEAFIDRHLSEFDVSDDLTFAPIMTGLGPINGITYTIPLNKKKEYNFKNLLE